MGVAVSAVCLTNAAIASEPTEFKFGPNITIEHRHALRRADGARCATDRAFHGRRPFRRISLEVERARPAGALLSDLRPPLA